MKIYVSFKFLKLSHMIKVLNFMQLMIKFHMSKRVLSLNCVILWIFSRILKSFYWLLIIFEGFS
jgi:hypothetical protein